MLFATYYVWQKLLDDRFAGLQRGFLDWSFRFQL